MTQSPDYSSIPDSAWEFLTETPTHRCYIADIGDGKSVVKTEYLFTDELLAGNQFLRNETDGQRWGDTPKVASIPLNVLYSSQSQIMEKLREGDRDHMKWWLNRPENEIYRTKRGRV
jgi:hypothetical protein